MNLFDWIKNKKKLPGIVRRITDTGQIYIPRTYRTKLEIRAGDPIEICIDHKKKCLVLKKYKEDDD